MLPEEKNKCHFYIEKILQTFWFNPERLLFKYKLDQGSKE